MKYICTTNLSGCVLSFIHATRKFSILNTFQSHVLVSIAVLEIMLVKANCLYLFLYFIDTPDPEIWKSCCFGVVITSFMLLNLVLLIGWWAPVKLRDCMLKQWIWVSFTYIKGESHSTVFHLKYNTQCQYKCTNLIGVRDEWWETSMWCCPLQQSNVSSSPSRGFGQGESTQPPSLVFGTWVLPHRSLAYLCPQPVKNTSFSFTFK